MDKITHEIRLSNWKAIIEQYSLRSEGQTVKQWLADNGINEKTYYYWQRRVRKEVFGQSGLSKPIEDQKTDTVSFAEIPVMAAQRETALDAPFHADAVIQTGNTAIGLTDIRKTSTRILKVFW